MTLCPHKKGITTDDEWFDICPPKKGKRQWEDGRSAKELAKYITASLPAVPAEMEEALRPLVPANAVFMWDAEYETALPGKGEGRNHDLMMCTDGLLVTVEAKADETFGNLVKDELHDASVNKLHRISELVRTLFKGGYTDYPLLRYQLLTASVGTLLEAKKQKKDTAVLLVTVFKTNGNVNEQRLTSNHKDVLGFLDAVAAYEEHGMWVIPNNTDVKLYFKELVI